MGSHDVLHDMQAYARVVVADNGIEHVFLGLLWQADAIIRDADGAILIGLVYKHLDTTITGREHHRVVQKNLNGLSQHVVVEFHREVGRQGEEGKLQALAFWSLELGTLLLHKLLQVTWGLM